MSNSVEDNGAIITELDSIHVQNMSNITIGETWKFNLMSALYIPRQGLAECRVQTGSQVMLSYGKKWLDLASISTYLHILHSKL
jgi:hypothetical protein